MRVVVDGLSHGHVAYFLEELLIRRQHVNVVAIRLYEDREEALLPSWFDGVVVHSSVELLDRFDAEVVLLSGPYTQRAEVAVAAMERGIHVLADKPLATNPDDLDRLVHSARDADSILSVAFEKRWYPATLQAQFLIRSGVLGDIRLVNASGPHKLVAQSRGAWFFDQRYGSILTDLPTHDLDLMLAFTQGQWGSVRGWTSPHHPLSFAGFSDACSVALTVENRAAVNIDAHWIWPQASEVHGRYQMRITGTLGTIFIDWSTNTVEVVSDAAAADLEAAQEYGRSKAKRPAENFFDAILVGAVPEVDTATSLRATQLAVMAAESSRNAGAELSWDFRGHAQRAGNHIHE